MKIRLYYRLNSGWASFDDVSLKRVGYATNLVTNPGFESTGGWTENRSSSFPGTSFWRSNWGPATPHGGTYSYLIGNLAYGGLESGLYPVRASAPYELHAWLRGEIDADDNGYGYILRALFYDANQGYLGYVNASTGGPGSISATWQQKGGQITSLPNAAWMRIQVKVEVTAGWVAYDDVSLAAQEVVTRYYYAGSTRVAMRRGLGLGNGKLNWLLADHLGSQAITVSTDGLTEEGELRYKAWGETRFTSGTTPTKRQYTGQVSEMATIGLYFYGARFYDPALSRFTQADSFIPGAADVQAWDRYAAMLNNPVNRIDPTGHSSGAVMHDSYGDAQCNDPDHCMDAAGMSKLSQSSSDVSISRVRIGARPATQPSLTGPYSGQPIDDTCFNCSAEPQLSGAAAGLAGGPAVFNMAGAAVLNHKANNDADAIFLYAYQAEYSNGNVAIDSLEVINTTNMGVSYLLTGLHTTVNA